MEFKVNVTIEGLQELSEAVVLLASAIGTKENHFDEVVAGAKKETKKSEEVKAKKETKKAEHKPAKEETDAEDITVEALREEVNALIKSGSISKKTVKSMLDEFGHEALGSIPEGERTTFVTKVKEACNEEEL